MKRRSIQNNLYLILEILEEVEDNVEAILINFNQSIALDRVDYQFKNSQIQTKVPQMDKHSVPSP